ncbi:MAG: type II restriction endonuclease [Bacteroidota bacterium]
MEQALSNYFSGIGAKRLSAVETNPEKSNQHEFNGISEFKAFFGETRRSFSGKFIYLTDNEDETLIEEGTLTWYDARENHPTRTEFRLYYTPNPVISSALDGDLLIIGKTGENELAVIIAVEGSTAERQMKWLFGLQEVENKYIVRNIVEHDQELNFAGKQVIETLGFEVEESEPGYLEQIIGVFGETFPKTSDFSKFARTTLSNDVSPVEEPDKTLIAWLEREELLFKTLEKHIVSKRLKEGFGEDGLDVDAFVKYSLSVQNRRKSRAGHSFENHLEAIFLEHQVAFSKGKNTERKNKPDFLFPSIEKYHDDQFDSSLLTMLGVKTTAKDRWRQVLSEADRIERKHLVTLQPAISINQTTEMQEQNLQLVIPEPLKETYTAEQQPDLIDLKEFITLVKSKTV